jgi:hypothetical protein
MTCNEANQPLHSVCAESKGCRSPPQHGMLEGQIDGHHARPSQKYQGRRATKNKTANGHKNHLASRLTRPPESQAAPPAVISGSSNKTKGGASVVHGGGPKPNGAENNNKRSTTTPSVPRRPAVLCVELGASCRRSIQKLHPRRPVSRATSICTCCSVRCECVVLAVLISSPRPKTPSRDDVAKSSHTVPPASVCCCAHPRGRLDTEESCPGSEVRRLVNCVYIAPWYAPDSHLSNAPVIRLPGMTVVLLLPLHEMQTRWKLTSAYDSTVSQLDPLFSWGSSKDVDGCLHRSIVCFLSADRQRFLPPPGPCYVG